MRRTDICDVPWCHPNLLTKQDASRPVPHVCAISGAVTVMSLPGMIWWTDCTVKLPICFSNSKYSDQAMLHSSRSLVVPSQLHFGRSASLHQACWRM